MTARKGELAQPESWGFGAAIDGVLYRLAVGPGREIVARWGTAEDPQRVNTNANPEDFTAEFGETHSRVDFTYGSGLDRAHRRNAGENDWARYWDAKGVRVWGAEPGARSRITLQRAMVESFGWRGNYAFIGDEPDTLMVVMSDGTLIWTDLNQVWSSTTPGDAVPGITVESLPALPTATYGFSGLAELGDEVWASCANWNGSTGAVLHRDNTGTWTTKTSGTAIDGLWVVKERVVVATGGSLYQPTTGTWALNTALAGLAPNESWVDVTDAGSHILATSTDGHIYSFAWDGTDLTLDSQTEVEGETPRYITEAQGVVMYGTREPTTAGGYIGRLWRAVLNPDTGILVDSQLLRVWGDTDTTEDRSPGRMWAARDFIATSVMEDWGNPGDAVAYVWRYDLATGGLHRDVKVEDRWQYFVGPDVWRAGLVYVDGRAILHPERAPIYRESDTTYVSTGWLIGAAADFFTADPKQWVSGTVFAPDVPPGTAATLYLSPQFADLDQPDRTIGDWRYVTTQDFA